MKKFEIFFNNLFDGQEELQILGQNEIEWFLQFREIIFEEARIRLLKLEQNSMHGEDEDTPENLKLSDALDKLNIQFEDAINDLWQALMAQELYLHESIQVMYRFTSMVFSVIKKIIGLTLNKKLYPLPVK